MFFHRQRGLRVAPARVLFKIYDYPKCVENWYSWKERMAYNSLEHEFNNNLFRKIQTEMVYHYFQRKRREQGNLSRYFRDVRSMLGSIASSSKFYLSTFLSWQTGYVSEKVVSLESITADGKATVGKMKYKNFSYEVFA